MYKHSLCIHISHESHCIALWPFKTAQLHSPLYSVRNTKYQFLIQFFQMPHCQVLNMLLENAFCSLHTPPPYLMFYSTFCKAYAKTLGLGSFQYHLPTLTIQPNLFHIQDRRFSTLGTPTVSKFPDASQILGQTIATTLMGLHIHISCFCTTYRFNQKEAKGYHKREHIPSSWAWGHFRCKKSYYYSYTEPYTNSQWLSQIRYGPQITVP